MILRHEHPHRHPHRHYAGHLHSHLGLDCDRGRGLLGARQHTSTNQKIGVILPSNQQGLIYM